MVPAPVPVTTPEVDTEPMDGFALLQVPPDVTSLKVVVAPPQSVATPVIGDGCSQMVSGVAVFQRSPASEAELWFTALRMP